jgi:hypothetical protein
MSYSPEYIKGAIAALNEVKASGLAMAMHVGIIHGKESGEGVKSLFDSVADPLIGKYKTAGTKDD